ncbi:hypothetical protein, partial [Gluconobacter cerinus]|uniref:hypothetical protein n=1 Tax=Gluconobacter cerinus TaxID=38307 RepID=UPI001B8BDB75
NTNAEEADLREGRIPQNWQDKPSKLETRKNRVISGEAGWLDDVGVLRGAPRASFGPISTIPGVDSAGFADRVSLRFPDARGRSAD